MINIMKETYTAYLDGSYKTKVRFQVTFLNCDIYYEQNLKLAATCQF